MRVLDWIELARPKDWIKNVFVFLPVPFALAAGAHLDPLSFALGLVGMCLTSSGIYAVNDAQDAERDRAHPQKARRPIASGRVPVAGAHLFAVVLVLTGGGLAYAGGGHAAVAVVVLYVLFNIAYSFGAKHVPLLDVFLLSTGFVLRVVLGCVLVGVRPSNWLLLCSSALALFLALAKRRADVVKGLDAEHRPSLDGYNRSFLDQALAITAAMTVIAYALYCLDAAVLIPGREFASLPFVVFGTLEWLRIANLKGEGGSPVDLLLSSPVILVSGFGWLVAIWWSVQLP